MEITPQILVLGSLTGLAYAVLAAGLVLIYRATRVINFAHGQMGALGAAVLAKLVLDYNWNYVLALAVVIVIGAGIGLLVESVVMRRLFDRPRIILLVATIGIAQLLFAVQALAIDIENSAPYPTPIQQTIELGTLRLVGQHFLAIAVIPALIVGLGLLLTATPYGIAIRASADNADAAQLAGISVKRISTLVWVLAGILATVTIVVVNPLRGVVVGAPNPAFGPGLVLRALAAALVGRLVSLPLTLLGGVAVGIFEAVLFVNYDIATVDLMLLVAILALVLLRYRGLGSADEGSHALAPRVRAIPEHLKQIPWVRNLPWIAGGATAALGVTLPFVFPSAERVSLFSQMLIFALVALSVTVVTGWGGQLSLAQFAFVGCGAMVTAALVSRGVPFGIAAIWATVGTVLIALAVGAPALRIRGPFLAVTTLAFAVAARGWLFTRPLFIGDTALVTLPRGQLGPVDLTSQRTYYFLCLLVLGVAAFVVSQLRRTGVGRALIAVRDNEPAAAAFTVSPAKAKLTAFAVSGALAAIAGAMLAGLVVQVRPEAFGPQESLRVVAMTIIGGLGSVAGAVLGAVYVVGLPAIFGNAAEVRALTSGGFLLILLLYVPGGLIQLVYAARDALLRRAAQHIEEGEGEAPARSAVRASGPVRGADSDGSPEDGESSTSAALRATDVTVRFGGLVAVDRVSIEARQGELVGLIGPNGAGKSTLMNAISGFVPAQGRIEIFGHDVTPLPAHERAHRGLGRVFQDARLFGDLTVREAVLVALEARERSELLPSALALPPSLREERTKAAEATELIGFLGLGRYANAFISELSTGTRRIAELACLLALDAKVLLLDEPTAGVAQRETEAFGPLVRRIQDELGATVLVIEHDIPLVMSISDRVYCMAAGELIAQGTPEGVQTDPAVIASYLGTDERAIRRSGVV